MELILCISSALRRGLLDDTEAGRYDKDGATIAEGFALGGLGLLVDACAHTDRMVTFGG